MRNFFCLLLLLCSTAPVLAQRVSSGQIAVFAQSYSEQYRQLITESTTGLLVFGDAVPQTGILIVRRSDAGETPCSATAIGSRHILTAAHCVCTDLAPTFSDCEPRLAGISATFLSPSQGVFQVEQGRVWVSPNYLSNNVETRDKRAPVADLAIFELNAPIAQYAKLGTFVSDGYQSAEGQTYYTQQGYGTLGATDNSETAREFPKPNKWYQFGVPQTVGYPRVQNDCGPKVPSDRLCYDVDKIPSSNRRQADATLCDGDSGSGLFAWSNGQPILVAVASTLSNSACRDTASFHQTAFYVSVEAHRKWIDSIVAGESEATSEANDCHDLILDRDFTVEGSEAATLAVIPFSMIPDEAHKQRRPHPDMVTSGGASCELVIGASPEFRGYFCELPQDASQVSVVGSPLQAIRLCEGENDDF